MTPKERVLLSISHTEPDRVPLQIYLTPEIGQRLKDYFGGRSPHEVLEIDFRHVGAKGLKPPRQPEPGSGIVYYDIWGVPYKHVEHGAGGAYDETADFVLARLKTLDDVENYPWPSPDDYDYSVIPAQIDAVADYAVQFGGAGIPDIINGVSRGRGMEQVLVDIGLEDEVGAAIIDHRVDFYYEHCRRALEAGEGRIDILQLGEDLGTERGPMMSPETFNRFFRPRLRRFIDLAHEFGARAMLHCCGSSRNLIPYLIEMGLDVLDAVQPEPVGMNPEELKGLYGGALTFCGMISTQHTLPFGTEADCRAEARHRLDVIARGGGYIFSPAHCMQPDTPINNILAIYEEALGRRLIQK